MKKTFALLLCLTCLFLPSCGSAPADDSSSATSFETTESVETTKRADVLYANDAYGSAEKTDGVSVTDRSVQYRTKDSVRLEPVAVRAAEQQIRNAVAQPDSLEIKSVNVSNCADDGACVYYTLYFNTFSLVGTGEQVRHVYYYDIGVRKSDETTFDASGEMQRVLEAYSIFQLQASRDTVVFDSPMPMTETAAFSDAAEKIAVSRLKKADGNVVSVKQRLRESDGSEAVWDVLCEGENDYGMRITDVYAVYFRYGDGNVVEYDPAE